MFGGGIYSMSSIKEIKVTEGFKTLTEDQKQCQTTQTLERCLAEQLMVKTVENCKCVPYEMQNFNNETIDVNTYLESQNLNVLHSRMKFVILMVSFVLKNRRLKRKNA